MSEAAVTPTEAPAAPPVEPVVEAPVTEAAPSSWRDGIDEGLRENPSLTKFEDVNALGKSYVELSGLIHKKGIIPIDENSTDEQRAEYHKAMGVPETTEGYELGAYQPPEILAEIWDANGVSEVAEKARELGVSKDQFNGMVDALAQSQAKNLGEHIQGVEQKRAAVESGLKEKYGAAFPEKIAQAKAGMDAAAAAVGLTREELAGQSLPDGSFIGDNAALTEIFSMLGAQGDELGFHGGRGGRIAMTPAEVETELAEINSNPALYERGAPEHKALVARRDALNQMTSSG